MTVEEIFATLSTHMKKGLVIHDQLASAYGFLHLCGYQSYHESQYRDEMHEYRTLCDYYIDRYNKLIEDDQFDYPTIIPQTWYRYTRQDVDSGTKQKSIRDLMQTWIDWERETQTLLQTSYKNLQEIGEIAAADFLTTYIIDNAEELRYAEGILLDLEAHKYDMSLIISEQETRL